MRQLVVSLIILALAALPATGGTGSYIDDIERLGVAILDGRFDEAEAMARANPDLLHGFQNSTAEISEQLDRWVRQRPGSALAHAFRGRYWTRIGFMRRSRAALRMDAVDESMAAEEALRQATQDHLDALARDPTIRKSYVDLMNIAATTSNFTEVLDFARAAIANGGESTELYIQLGEILFRLIPTERAHRIIDALVGSAGQRRPEGVDLARLALFPLSFEGREHQAQARFEEALEVYEEILKLERGEFHLPIYAEILNSLGRTDEARAARLRYVTEVNPVYIPLRINLAWHHRQDGDLEGSLALLETALRVDPGDSQVLRDLGYTHYRLERYDEALEHYRRALLHGEDDDEVQRMLGWLELYITNKYERAARHYARAIALDGDRRDDFYQHAKALRYALDCAAIPAYRKYQTICEREGDCRADRQAEVRDEVARGLNVCTEGGEPIR